MKIEENKRIVPIDGACQYEAPRLYSLCDMISFLADGLYSSISWLEGCQKIAEEQLAQHGSGSHLTQENSDLIWRQLNMLLPHCEKFKLTHAYHSATKLGTLVVPGIPPPECSVAIVLIKNLLSVVNGELRNIQFAIIPSEKVQYFEQHDLFGEPVSSAFPSSQPEIKDAGNCLAAELHTAAVFHLMRAVEYGLRALALHLKVRIVGRPLDQACWGEVLRAIDKKLKALQGKSRGKKKNEELESYGRLLQECEYFKDAWRNPVSHARGRNSEAGALDVYGHVRDFMQKLVSRGIRERN